VLRDDDMRAATQIFGCLSITRRPTASMDLNAPAMVGTPRAVLNVLVAGHNKPGPGLADRQSFNRDSSCTNDWTKRKVSSV
jgi:hypothetical protein